MEFDLYHVKTNKAFNWVFGVQRKFIEQLPVTQQNGVYFLKADGLQTQTTFLRVYIDMTCLRTVRILS